MSKIVRTKDESVLGTENTPQTDLRTKAMQRAQADVCALVEEHMPRIWESMQRVQEDAEAAGDDCPPALKVSLSVALRPFGRHTVNVSASISYGTKVKDATAEIDITDHPELPLK